MDFRACISNEKNSGRLKTVSEPLPPYLQVSKRLIELEPDPVLFESVSDMQVAGNIFFSREKFAEYLQLQHADFLSQLAQKLDSPEETLEVRQQAYGDQELSSIDLSKLPILFHYPGDGGYYLTSAVWIVNDPELGRNLSYHRMMLLDQKRGSVRVVENRGTHHALAHSQGKAEVAICIAPPPAVLLAASFSPPGEIDEMKLAARLTPITLAPCKTIDIHVPIDCEIVLEGHFTGEFAREGPFVDITGTWDIVRQQPLVEITRIAWRNNPIYHALVPGRSEHRILMGMPKEVDIFQAVNEVCQCCDVTLTSGGCSWLHAVVQIKKETAADGEKALAAAFHAHRSLKHCIVVDDDIDIHNVHDVEWAIATRFQADKDLLVMPDQPSSSLDPSAIHVEGKKSRGTKMGLDATIKNLGQEREMFERVKF
ncbi:MAG: UbiD family decarboxylase [bacterium]|nr:UbiD family decarboxylase [bacterium]